MGLTLHMIMCFLLCYPVSFHMLQLLLTGHPISSYCKPLSPTLNVVNIFIFPVVKLLTFSLLTDQLRLVLKSNKKLVYQNLLHDTMGAEYLQIERKVFFRSKTKSVIW